MPDAYKLLQLLLPLDAEERHQLNSDEMLALAWWEAVAAEYYNDGLMMMMMTVVVRKNWNYSIIDMEMFDNVRIWASFDAVEELCIKRHPIEVNVV